MTGTSARSLPVLPDPDTEPVIDAPRAAAVLKLSTRAILYACQRGECPSIRVGRAVRIPTRKFLVAYGLADQAAAPDKAA